MENGVDHLRDIQNTLEVTQGKNHSRSESVLVSGLDLSALSTEAENVFYFGVLIPGERAELIFKGDTVTTVEPGNKFSEIFTSVNFIDGAGASVDPKGLFRGYKITLQ